MKYLPCLILLLTACCTPMTSPNHAMDRVNKEFDGRYVGLFFASYGGAGGSMNLDEGGKLYHWVSIEPAGGSSSSDEFSSAGGHYGIPEGGASNGEIVTGYCKVNISTDARDSIIAITLVADSIGKFSGSRCAEIFGQSDK